MLGTWADYVGYPGGAALAAAGFTGVIRYVGIGGAAKRLTAAEYADLTAHGLRVLGVVESTTTEADNGYAAGVADARATLADLAQLSTPVPFVFATNDKPTYVQADVDYVRGFRDVLGMHRTGAYGFGDFLRAVANAGVASVFWQAGHPPNLTGTQDIVHFWQRQGTLGNGSDGLATPTTETVGGVNCDINNQLRELPVTGPVWSQTDENTLTQLGVQINHLWPAGSLTIKNPATDPMSLVDKVEWLVHKVPEILAAVSGVDSDVRAAQTEVDGRIAQVVATLGGLSAGAVDVGALAASLAPLLNAQEGTTLITALRAQFEK